MLIISYVLSQNQLRKSIEIENEKHSTMDQEGKPLDNTWRALCTMAIDFFSSSRVSI